MNQPATDKEMAKHKKAVLALHVLPEQQNDFEVLLGANRGYSVERSVSDALHLYFKRGYITEAMFMAGRKLQDDFDFAGIFCIKAMLLREAPGGTAKEFTEAQLDARQRWRDAIDSVSGRDGRLMVLDVCCYGDTLVRGDYLLYKNPDSRMPRFVEAMDDLARHYRY